MLRSFLVVALIALAPMQCRGREDPALAVSETPGDALYGLAQQFREKGQDDAYRQTLEYLVNRYPSSRRAVMAKSELDALK